MATTVASPGAAVGGFTAFTREAIRFPVDLAQNNDRGWFQAPQFTDALPLMRLLATLLARVPRAA